MADIYCSTGAFIGKANGRNHKLISSQGRLLPCDGLELMLYNDWYPTLDKVLGDARSSGLRFPVIHAEKTVTDLIMDERGAQREEALRLFEENCRAAQTLGAFLVLHLWQGSSPASQIESLLSDAMPRLLAVAHRHGVELTIENVPFFEGSALGILKRLSELYPTLRYTIDVRHTAYQGKMDAVMQAGWLWPKVRHLHISDFMGEQGDLSLLSKAAMPGKGKIPFERWFARAREAGYAGSVTLESSSIGPEGIGDLPAVRSALLFLREGFPSGNASLGGGNQWNQARSSS